MAYDNEMKGTLWYNQNRESDNHPHCTGKIQINGVEYRVAGWGKTLDSGKKVLNLKIQEQDGSYQSSNNDPAISDDACPF